MPTNDTDAGGARVDIAAYDSSNASGGRTAMRMEAGQRHNRSERYEGRRRPAGTRGDSAGGETTRRCQAKRNKSTGGAQDSR